MGIQLEISELSSRSVMTNHDSCPTADRWGRSKRTIRTPRCALQPEGFQHLSQPNSAEVSSVTGSHASTHAIAMIARRGNERPRTSRQTRRRNADCSVGLVNVDHEWSHCCSFLISASGVYACFTGESFELPWVPMKASTRSFRPVVVASLVSALEVSARSRLLSSVLGSSANCFWTLDPSRLSQHPVNLSMCLSSRGHMSRNAQLQCHVFVPMRSVLA